MEKPPKETLFDSIPPLGKNCNPQILFFLEKHLGFRERIIKNRTAESQRSGIRNYSAMWKAWVCTVAPLK